MKQHQHFPSFTLTCVLFLALLCLDANRTILAAAATTVDVITDGSNAPPTLHGLNKLKLALRDKGASLDEVTRLESARGEMRIVTGLASGTGPAAALLKTLKLDAPTAPESLLIHHVDSQGRKTLLVTGSDARGLMYALLDVADRVGWAADPKNPLSEVRQARERPAVSERALSIYTMQRAYFESHFHDAAYWDRYFDLLARNRFNSFVLIFGYENGGYFAPAYPWFFDVEGFSNVRVPNVTREQQVRNLAALNLLIRQAHDHGLRVTLGLWDHIYRGGVQSGGMREADPNKPGPDRVWGVTKTNLMAYSQVALAKFLKAVPDFDALQFRMHDESGLKPGEEQHEFWKNIFQVVKDARPQLPLTLRAKGLPDEIIDLGLDMGLNVRVSTKYWMEQMGLPFHPTHIPRQDQFNRRHGYADLLRYPQRYKMHWRLWNGGTARVLLWGDPDYARRFAESTHLYDGDGFEVNEPLATKMASHSHDQKPFDLLTQAHRYYDYEFERYWHFYQVFGRIGYNPDTSDEVWQKEFERRFGKDAAPYIERALHRASWILPRLVASVFPYGKFPTTRGWPEKQRWDDLPSYARAEGSDTLQFQGFEEAARNRTNGTESAKISPEQNSEWFAHTSKEVLDAVAEAEKRISTHRNKEFESTVVDLKIVANLALYHSRRIPAGLAYATFKQSQDATALDDAIAHERHAIEAWQKVVEAAADFYNDDLMMGLPSSGLSGHWRDELLALKRGLESLEKERSKLRPTEGPAKPGSVATKSDNVPPTLTHKPITTASAEKPLTVTVQVRDPSGVKWVRVLYRSINQYFGYKSLPMQPTGHPDEFAATIPGEDLPVKWDFQYFFEIMDTQGNGKIYPDLEKETPYVVVSLQR